MSVELEASASIGVAIGDKLDKLHGLLAKEKPRPLFYTLAKALPASGAVVLGNPPVGRIWNILAVAVMGADDHTAQAGASVAIYTDSTEGNLSIAQCALPGLAVPSNVSISKGTLWAHSSGSVIANATGVGAGGVVIAVRVAEWSDHDVSANYVR